MKTFYCQDSFESEELEPLCKKCTGNDIQEGCSQCGYYINEDTKYCSECKEVVA